MTIERAINYPQAPSGSYTTNCPSVCVKDRNNPHNDEEILPETVMRGKTK